MQSSLQRRSPLDDCPGRGRRNESRSMAFRGPSSLVSADGWLSGSSIPGRWSLTAAQPPDTNRLAGRAGASGAGRVASFGECAHQRFTRDLAAAGLAGLVLVPATVSEGPKPQGNDGKKPRLSFTLKPHPPQRQEPWGAIIPQEKVVRDQVCGKIRSVPRAV